MGRFYTYKCKECDFENSYYTGGGFFTEEYFNKVELAATSLKEEVLSGKYGEHLKRIVSLEQDAYHFNCGTALFSCSKCKDTFVLMSRSISHTETGLYRETIEFNELCPICKNDTWLFKHDGDTITCPKCKNAAAELVSIGLWD